MIVYMFYSSFRSLRIAKTTWIFIMFRFYPLQQKGQRKNLCPFGLYGLFDYILAEVYSLKIEIVHTGDFFIAVNIADSDIRKRILAEIGSL